MPKMPDKELKESIPWELEQYIPQSVEDVNYDFQILPGETAQPGTVNGKSGPPDTWYAGAESTVTVNVCDGNWNINTSTQVEIEITTTDQYDSNPVSQNTSGGSYDFQLTMIVSSDIAGA